MRKGLERITPLKFILGLLAKKAVVPPSGESQA